MLFSKKKKKKKKRRNFCCFLVGTPQKGKNNSSFLWGSSSQSCCSVIGNFDLHILKNNCLRVFITLIPARNSLTDSAMLRYLPTGLAI